MDAEGRSDRAAQILNDEIFQEAAKNAKEKLKDAWAKAADPLDRESLWHQYKASEAVTRELTIIRDNGIVERNRREKEKDRA